MTTIKKIFNIALSECGADSSDILENDLLQIFNENMEEFVAKLQSKKSEEFFSVNIFHDLIEGQIKYGNLEYTNSSDKTVRISKILKVKVLGKKRTKVDVLNYEHNENDKTINYGINGVDLYVYHNEEGIIEDGIEVIGLIPYVKIDNSDIEVKDIFNGIFHIEEKIIKLGLKEFIYSKLEKDNKAKDANQDYKKELRSYINRIGRTKDFIERELPDLSHLS